MKKLLRCLTALAIIGAVMIATGCEAKAAPPTAKKPDAKKIQKELLAIMEEHDVTAMNIAVVKGDEVIYTNALGLKNRETGEAVAIDDLFRIASISKSFSGVSTM